MDKNEARKFCDKWLPAWAGNQPEKLIEFYSEDAFYRDPRRPNGVSGKQALLTYFRKLLANFPDWVWEVDDTFSIEKGFILRWNAMIHVGEKSVREKGMDLVLVKDGLITRNEVYFDRTALLQAMKQNAAKS
ncbi:MAG: nuclear transport factor 2 family protein [Deltaproteobacteria bacterium]|nr:nuclear transport factor 2 family protein [Deltaproteobacteria bacterium]